MKLLQNTKFRSEIKRFIKEHHPLDVVLFGSSTSGKVSPKDVDLMVIFPEKADLNAAHELRKTLEHIGINAQLTTKTWAGLLDPQFAAREAFLAEGYSLAHETFLAEGLGYANQVLFKYDLTGMGKSARMRFYYSLLGRNGPGMLAMHKASKLSDNLVLAPVTARYAFREYFEHWKIQVLEIPVLYPSRLKGHI